MSEFFEEAETNAISEMTEPEEPSMTEWKGPYWCEECGRSWDTDPVLHRCNDGILSGATPYDRRRGPDPEKQELVEQLADCVCQIEYLHAKFQETGSGNTTLVRSRALLRPYF